MRTTPSPIASLPLPDGATGEKGTEAFAITTPASLPSLRELNAGLQSGFDPNSTAGHAGGPGARRPRTALWFYTWDLQRTTGAAAPAAIRETLACIRALIDAGAHGFDPITGPDAGCGFVASVLRADYLDTEHSGAQLRDAQALIEETLDVVRLAVSRGARLDFGHSSGDSDLLGLLLNDGRGQMAAEALRMGAPMQCRFGQERPPLEFAQAKCSPAGLALVTEALMARRLQLAQQTAAAAAHAQQPAPAPRRRARV